MDKMLRKPPRGIKTLATGVNSGASASKSARKVLVVHANGFHKELVSGRGARSR